MTKATRIDQYLTDIVFRPGNAVGLAYLRTTTCLAGSSSRTSDGWAAGLGAEWAFWGNTTLKVEYLHIDLGDEHIRLVAQSPATGTGFLNARFDNSYDIFH
jgi:opacity protein-like surface antigen